jgi:hypothetical protein
MCKLFNTDSLPPLRFHCVGGRWGRTLDLIHDSVRCHPHSTRSHPFSARSHLHLARSHPYIARSHPPRLDLSHDFRLDRIHTQLDLIHNSARSHPHSARSHPHSARSHPCDVIMFKIPVHWCQLVQLTNSALFEVTCALFPLVVYYGDSADLQCPGGKYTLHIFSLPLLTLLYVFIHFVKKTIIAISH